MNCGRASSRAGGNAPAPAAAQVRGQRREAGRWRQRGRARVRARGADDGGRRRRDASYGMARDSHPVSTTAVSRVSQCARGGASASGFRSGGAGAQLWGLFGASRSKPAGRGVGRVTLWRRVSSCARGQRLGQLFRSGGAGAQLRGLFGASRSKPLAEGWLWRVCALAFQAG